MSSPKTFRPRAIRPQAIRPQAIWPQATCPQIISSSNSVLWKTGRNFGLKSRLIFWAEIIRPEMQFRPPDVLALRSCSHGRDKTFAD